MSDDLGHSFTGAPKIRPSDFVTAPASMAGDEVVKAAIELARLHGCTCDCRAIVDEVNHRIETRHTRDCELMRNDRRN
jgi:hypothetical protein